MADVASSTRTFRSRSPWFWVYVAAIVVVLFALMFLVADRVTRPSPSSGFEPVGTADNAEPANEFLPADRPVSECISAVPKPGCGSEARGGWRQGLVLVAILAGLALIVWRIVVGARRARRDRIPAG